TSAFSTEELLLPFEIGRFTLGGGDARAVWAHARQTGAPDGEILEGRVTLLDEGGAVVAEVTGIKLKRAAWARGARGGAGLYRLAWREVAAPAGVTPPRGSWLLIGPKTRLRDALAVGL